MTLLKTNNALKHFRLERSPAYQSSVDIILLHKDVYILRFNRATIQYSYLGGNIFLIYVCQQISDKAVCFLGLVLCGSFPGADCPDRLIGHNKPGAVSRL